MMLNTENRFALSLVVALTAGLVISSHYNFLLFHSLAEVFSIIVAAGIFGVAWNSRDFSQNSYLFFIGVAYLFIGFLDLIHTLAYKGMGVFPGHGANLPTQLWIAARFMESLTLFFAPFFIKKRIFPAGQFVFYSAISIMILLTIFWLKIFPDCFIEGSGLTPFKIRSEYVISLILAGAMVMTCLKREAFEKQTAILICTSISLTIVSELAFTFYISVYGLSNLVGHILKILSYYCIYKALIESGFRKPYSLLFRDLKESEQTLRQEKVKLEEALAQIKTLKGLIPICAKCKKIRDDEGFWNHIEDYIKKHSDAEFTHGICPDCGLELYPDFFKSLKKKKAN